MESAIVIFAAVVTIASCIPTGVYVDRNGEVGASFGGYSASAGLGGILGNGAKGGLHAEANTPDGYFAGAGLGGQVAGEGTQGGLYSTAGGPGNHPSPNFPPHPPAVAGSSASASSASSSFSGGSNVNVIKHPQKPVSFFDDIFNIPQSALSAVNELLNKRAENKLHGSITSSSTSGTGVAGEANKNTAASASSSSQVGATFSSQGGGATKYDQIFNIPKSVLSAVNQFLNRSVLGQ